jgi:two-component system, NarL family, sensor histidine kinase UhpB
VKSRVPGLPPRTPSPVAAAVTDRPDLASPRDAAAPRGPLRSLLRVPLFYKILIANAAIVVLGTIIGTAITARYLQQDHGAFGSIAFVLLLALVGVLVTLLVNAVILRLALTQLLLLEQTAARIHSGDLRARVPHSAFTDRDLERLSGTFNAMMESLDTYRQRLREVAARALRAEEEERKRISRELHDDTAQTLAALLIRLRLARAAPEGRKDQVLEDLRADLVGAIERVRRYARGLRPPALEELGLEPALESHVRALSESVGISIRVESEPMDGILNPQTELVLYRIAQEALSNAVRHAGADQIDVRLAPEGFSIVVSVTDNGSGFDLNAVTAPDEGGLGLFGMQERASYLGGKVEIRSSPGNGTSVRGIIPVGDAASSGMETPVDQRR